MATVNLILLQDVEDLGLAGDEVHVAAGFARNYLIPRNLASEINEAARRQINAHRAKIEAKRAADLAAAQELAGKLAAVVFEIHAQASDDGHLFGSVTDRMIADAIAEKGMAVPHQRIHLESVIRSCGEYEVPVKLHQSVIQNIKVSVVKAS